MPHPLVPTIADWVETLSKTVGKPDQDTIFVGHSIGCQTILRYLETMDTPVRGAVFVAGFFKLSGLRSEDERAIAKPWKETPMDLGKIKHILTRSIAIFSENDRFVPLEENREAFKQNLDSEIVVDADKKHFAGDQGIVELPSALEAVRRIADQPAQ